MANQRLQPTALRVAAEAPAVGRNPTRRLKICQRYHVQNADIPMLLAHAETWVVSSTMTSTRFTVKNAVILLAT